MRRKQIPMTANGAFEELLLKELGEDTASAESEYEVTRTLLDIYVKVSYKSWKKARPYFLPAEKT